VVVLALRHLPQAARPATTCNATCGALHIFVIRATEYC
jgi:hypothetical protein